MTPSLNKCTPKQRELALQLFAGKSQKEAYQIAYGGKQPTNASKYCNQAIVLAALTELRADIAVEAILTLESHMEELAKLRDAAAADGKWQAAISAEISRGKAAGLYTEKVEHKGDFVVTLSQSDMDL